MLTLNIKVHSFNNKDLKIISKFVTGILHVLVNNTHTQNHTFPLAIFIYLSICGYLINFYSINHNLYNYNVKILLK